MISSHDGELELLVYWTGTVSVVSHTGLGGADVTVIIIKILQRFFYYLEILKEARHVFT